MKKQIKDVFFHFLYWYLTLIFLEALLHGVVFGSFSGKFAYAAGFTAVFAGAVTLVITLLPRKIRFAGSILTTALLIFLYGSQLVYDAIFGTLYSVSMMQMGGAALTSFWRETLMAMGDKLGFLAMLLLPLIALILLQKFRAPELGSNTACRIGIVVLAAAVQLTMTASLSIGGTGFFSDYYFYHSSDTTTNQAAERFGLLTALRLELTGSGKSDDELYFTPEETQAPTEVPEETVPDATEPPPPEYNVLNIDFDALNEMTDDETIQAINEYCAGLTGTVKNEYTGMLRDYNLIVLCAESFDTAAIHPELTPTLYRLANEGIIFNNYYNAFPNTTTDGEYALCMGLYPDGTRDKQHSSFYASRTNYLAFALGNLFAEQRGIQTYGYHNYDGSYYTRNKTHPNMGYSMKFARDGMKFTTNWPASDLEMMEQSIDDYIGQDQFHAYYMTFSGHYRYDVSTNFIAKRNWEQVEDLEFSKAGRAYLSCNIELEKAMAYLMQRLEEEGVADRTAIVLAGDHFPYGLTDKQYSELIGYEIDDFSKFKSTLIFWVGGLEENIVVDEYCCNVDVLPTILNLWGFDYDSRMLAGTDVFSDAAHVAVLIDKSFYTDKVWFNSNTGEIRYLVDEREVSPTYIENMIKLIKTRFSISVDILNTDYYRFAIENGIPTPAPDPVETEPPEEPAEEIPVPEPTDAPAQPAGTPAEESAAPESTAPATVPEATEPAAVPESTEAPEATEVPAAPKETEAPEAPAGTEPAV